MAEKKVPIEEMLRLRGLKATPQRVAIYCIMCDLGHASADMVAHRMKERNIDITVATVYNVLDSLVSAGLLQRRMSLNNKRYYDINTYEHCHLYDVEDDTMKDYNDPELLHIVKAYLEDRRIRNFSVENIDIQILGRVKYRRKSILSGK